MLKKVISDESGRVLAWTLVILGIGVLLIPTLLAHASANLLAIRATEEGLKEQYAADAGVEYALFRLANGDCPIDEPFSTPMPVNGTPVTVTVTLKSFDGTDFYGITTLAATRDGGGTMIESWLQPAQSGSSGSSSYAAFGYALGSLDGDITMGGSSMTYSDDYPALNGDVYANGNVNLGATAQVYGDASAMGVINGASHVHGEKVEGAPPLVGPEIDTEAYKQETLNVDCAVCGEYTYGGNNWDPPPGVYEDPVHAKKNMTVNGSGTWTFEETVCAGVDTNKDLDIDGSVEVTFEGPVKVGGDLNVNSSGTVIFRNTVCVGQDLDILSSGTVVFEGPVHVGEGDIDISGSSLLRFGGTVYVEGDLKATGSRDIALEDTVYVCGEVDMSGSGVRGGQTVIAEGQIDLTGSAKLASEDIPFIVALHTSTRNSPADAAVKFSGSSWTSGIVYAPNGHIRLTGSNKVHGAAVGKWISIVGSVEIEYPIELGDREDWPDVVGEDDRNSDLEIITYDIDP